MPVTQCGQGIIAKALKKLGNLWWIPVIATILAYLFYSAAVTDLTAFNTRHSGWRGFRDGFLHGLIGDVGYVSRIDAAQGQLISWAVFWQNIFRTGFLLAVAAVVTKVSLTLRAWIKPIRPHAASPSVSEATKQM